MDLTDEEKFTRVSFKRNTNAGSSFACSLSTVLGREFILGQLQAAGCDLNAQDESGITPIMCACANSHTGILALLLRKGSKSVSSFVFFHLFGKLTHCCHVVNLFGRVRCGLWRHRYILLNIMEQKKWQLGQAPPLGAGLVAVAG